MNKEKMDAIGASLAKDLHLKRDKEHRDRWQTGWGTKTNTGLYLTINRMIQEANAGDSLKATPPDINQVEMTEKEIELCERAAKRLGFTQTAYTSTSGLWGLFCLPDHAAMKEGCFIKTRQFGLMFVSDLEDLQLHDLNKEQRKL